MRHDPAETREEPAEDKWITLEIGTDIDPVSFLEGLFELGEAVSWTDN